MFYVRTLYNPFRFNFVRRPQHTSELFPCRGGVAVVRRRTAADRRAAGADPVAPAAAGAAAVTPGAEITTPTSSPTPASQIQ